MSTHETESDFWSSLTLAIAEIRRRGVMEGKYPPINEDERALLTNVNGRAEVNTSRQPDQRGAFDERPHSSPPSPLLKEAGR
jgi:hypothetical protein